MCEYSGTENLEVMADAINYNDYLLSLILSNVDASDGVLDFGAGIGTFAKKIRGRVNNICCVEPDNRQAEIITNSKLVVYASIDEVKSESIDFIYSFNVLEHIEDDIAALRECFRALRPGGRLLIYVPAFQLLFSSMDRKVGHVRRYSLHEIREKISAAGFTITNAHYADSIGFLVSLLFLLLGNANGDINPKMLKVYDRYIFPLSRALDLLCNRLIGKNVVCVAIKS